MKNFPLDDYLKRIGLNQALQPTLADLGLLIRGSAYHIPFENLDIQLGLGINLDKEHLADKLIYRKRGGYCFELNGLFLDALHAIGYDARALLARVHVSGEPSARTHQLSLLEIDGEKWIADVGFGGVCPRTPLPLAHDVETEGDGMAFRLTDSDHGYQLQVKTPGGWMDLYSFDLGAVLPVDIELGNHFTSTSPASFFTTSRIASLGHPTGRTSLFNDTVTFLEEGNERHEQVSEDDLASRLQSLFGITFEGELKPLG